MVKRKCYGWRKCTLFISKNLVRRAQIDYHLVGSGDLIYRGATCISHWCSPCSMFSRQFVILISMPCTKKKLGYKILFFFHSNKIEDQISPPSQHEILNRYIRSSIPTQQAKMATSFKRSGFFREIKIKIRYFVQKMEVTPKTLPLQYI